MSTDDRPDAAEAVPDPADDRTPTRMILLLISAWDWLAHLVPPGEYQGSHRDVRGLVAEIGDELHHPVERTHRLVPVDLLRRVADAAGQNAPGVAELRAIIDEPSRRCR